MSDPQTVGELNIDLAAFKASVDKQFEAARDRTNVQNWLIGLLLPLFAGILGSEFLLRKDLGDVNVELGKLGVRMANFEAGQNAAVNSSKQIAQMLSGIGDAVARIEKTGNAAPAATPPGAATSAAPQMVDSGRPGTATTGAAPSATQALSLTSAELRSIRAAYNIKDQARKSGVTVGSRIARSAAITEALVQQVPKLKGFRVAFDPEIGSALIVNASDLVVAVVDPG